jgi:hypothetical protein
MKQIGRIAAIMGWPIPSVSYLYQRQRLLVPQIEEFAKMKVEEAYREMKPGSRVAGDGAWAHAKRAMQAQDTLVCLDTGKVVATEIVKIRRRSPKTRPGRRPALQLGDFNGSPQASEGEGASAGGSWRDRSEVPGVGGSAWW